jgi:thiamine biosynthesis protein ThiI
MFMNTRVLYLIRLGEIYLKGTNRGYFEKQLRRNISRKIRHLAPRYRVQKGRFFLEADEPERTGEIERALATTMGIVGFSRAIMCEKRYETISSKTIDLVRDHVGKEPVTFKIEARRADKGFEMDSYGIARALGKDLLDAVDTLTVDVRNPRITVFVEIRDRCYVYLSSTHARGPGGLPVGAAGRGLLMLSGGIDSPVAGYLMAGRGMRLEAVYFHTYPYTSDDALEKVKTLARTLSPYLNGLKLHVINFTPAQLHINSHAQPKAYTLLMRRAMVAISDMIAGHRHIQALITGESLSQVASQTIESLSFTQGAATMPVLRPLIGLDKEHIISIARKIGTYDTSILPYEDCCTIFSADHPIVRPDKETMMSLYESMGIEELLQEACDSRETISL